MNERRNEELRQQLGLDALGFVVRTEMFLNVTVILAN